MSYSLSEAAAKLDLSKDTIRYYEKEEMLPQIKRDACNHRIFSDSDLDWIFLIVALRNTEMGIKDIKKYLGLIRDGTKIQSAKNILESHKQTIQKKIKSYNQMLRLIDKKMEFYDQALANNVSCIDYEEAFKSFREELKHYE